MKVAIKDRTAFESLNPTDVAAYLHSTGWKEVEQKPGYSSVWQRTWKGETVALLMPMDRTISDYVLRMTEAAQLIAATEERSELETLYDLQTAGSDIIRVRFRFASAEDGSIPLERGEALVENAREIMLAGACAAVSRRPYYATLKPQQARDFVDHLRMGQTERGSYVLTVLSPVPPQLQPPQGTLFAVEPEPPFERLAVAQMNKALTALRGAADEASTTFQTAVFEKAVSEGVSANLCSALAKMSGPNAQARDELVFSFTWARTRPADPSLPRQIAFPGDRIPIIEEASRVLRSVAPREESEITGFVVKLQRDEGQGPLTGPVTVTTLIDGQMRKVSINLDEPENHQMALAAYERGVQIACRGDLVKQGQQWTLRNPRGFMLTNEE